MPVIPKKRPGKGKMVTKNYNPEKGIAGISSRYVPAGEPLKKKTYGNPYANPLGAAGPLGKRVAEKHRKTLPRNKAYWDALDEERGATLGGSVKTPAKSPAKSAVPADKRKKKPRARAGTLIGSLLAKDPTTEKLGG